MALENLISIDFSKEELKELDHHMAGIQNIFKGKTVNITPEQRKQYGSIGNHNKLIVDKAKRYMEQHPNWIPRFLDKEEFDRDHKTREQVESRVQLLDNLSQQLLDTKTLLDHDNYTNALSFYRMMRFLAGENEPGAKPVYEDMKVLFNKSSATRTDETE
ncbi:hypothetical protein [Aquimarina mytili]|uniref:Uncharacterized protein n=1 Tax=Aquimarina mytili TaxID=874423 RepID=A0A937D7R1_9FLAO|nr:hypothetical protein [Aquimarina mytili]MBL0685809.1 hypothetical protein [Aquimarina mytili]